MTSKWLLDDLLCVEAWDYLRDTLILACSGSFGNAEDEPLQAGDSENGLVAAQKVNICGGLDYILDHANKNIGNVPRHVDRSFEMIAD